MFYCDRCAHRRGWRRTIFRSTGPCELCQRTQDCSDMPSKFLPLPDKRMQVKARFTDTDGDERIITCLDSGRVYHTSVAKWAAGNHRHDRYFDQALLTERVRGWLPDEEKEHVA